MSVQTEKIKELVELRAKARMGGGEKAIEKQHAKGKYTGSRTHRHAARSGQLRGNGYVQAAPLHELRHGEETVLGRRRGNRAAAR